MEYLSNIKSRTRLQDISEAQLFSILLNFTFLIVMAPITKFAVALVGCLSSLALGAPTATSNDAKLLGKRASINDVRIDTLEENLELSSNGKLDRPPRDMPARTAAPREVLVVLQPLSRPTLLLPPLFLAIPPRWSS